MMEPPNSNPVSGSLDPMLVGEMLLDESVHGSGEIRKLWSAMRDANPVMFVNPPDAAPFWAVTGYPEARQVLMDWRNFSSENGTLLRDTNSPMAGAGAMLTLTDPPDHRRLARIAMSALAPAAVGSVAERCGSIMSNLLAFLADNEAKDLTEYLRTRLVLEIAHELFDVPPSDLPYVTSILESAEDAMASIGTAESSEAHAQVMAYYADRLEDSPSTWVGLLEAIGRAPGQVPSYEETLLLCDNVAVGAAQTVNQAMLAWVEVAACFPATLQKVAGGRWPIRGVVDELLRWSTPVSHLMRTTTGEIVVGTSTISAGDTVVVWLPAANRDPRVFPNPSDFSPGRSGRGHIALGVGEHFCVGGSLTQMILTEFISEFAATVERADLLEQPDRIESIVSNGYRRLVARLTPAVQGD